MAPPEHLPPGPQWPATVQTILWSARPTSLARRCARRYGNAFTLRSAAGQRAVHLADTGLVRSLLDLPAESFSTDDPAERRAGELVRGPYVAAVAVLLEGGEAHQANRRAVSRAFHTQAMSAYRAATTEAAEKNSGTWPTGEVFALYPQMQRITLEVMLRAVLGVDPDEVDPLADLVGDYLELGGRLAAPAARRSPELARRLDELGIQTGAALDAHIDRRRSDPAVASRTDTLSAILAAGDEADRHSNSDLLELTMRLILAGHDPTATALSWTLDLLARHPAEADKLAAELHADRTEYLTAVVKESLRFRPVIPEIGRTLSRPVQLGRWLLPAGVTAVADVYLLHHDPDSYPEPERFRPERFLEGAPDPLTFLPFGSGMRRCLGAALAMLEIEQVVATVVRKFELQPGHSDPEPASRRLAALVPGRGAPVIVQRRKQLGT